MDAPRHSPEVDEVYQAVYQIEVSLYLFAALMALWLTSRSLF
jgi:hypothetical protein